MPGSGEVERKTRTAPSRRAPAPIPTAQASASASDTSKPKRHAKLHPTTPKRGTAPVCARSSSETHVELGSPPPSKRVKKDHVPDPPKPPSTRTTTAPTYPKRNLSQIKPKRRATHAEDDAHTHTSVSLPVSSTPVRGSGSHPVASTPQTKRLVDAAIQHELDGKCTEAGDLVDHLVGALLSAADAACVLQALLDDKYASIVQGPRGHKTVVDQAVRFAQARGCVRSDAPAPRAKAWLKSGALKLPLPPAPVDEAELVAFLNGLITRSLKALKKAGKGVPGRDQAFQFSAVRRQHHALPLSHPDDEADMRPDFGLLPLSAWPAADPMPPPSTTARPPVTPTSGPSQAKKKKLESNKSVNVATSSPSTSLLPAFELDAPAHRLDRFPRSFASERHLNFSAFRLVGESKTADGPAGKRQVKRYVRGLKRAQPWLRFALGLSYAKGALHVLRADQSGAEECTLDLTHPGHVLDAIRLLVGVAVMREEELGLDPAFTLGQRQEAIGHQMNEAGAGSSRSSSRPPSRTAKASEKLPARAGKRKADDVEGPTDTRAVYNVRHIETFSARTSTGTIYTYRIDGVLHISGSMRGRGTLAMAGKDASGKLVAIKRMWGDCARNMREEELFADMEHGIKQLGVKQAAGAAYLLRATRCWVVHNAGREDSTLRHIRGFRDDELGHPMVEDRLQQCLVTQLKRPIALFWSLQDMVGGLIDAIKGHQFLVEHLGILHRDVSETNIVLCVGRTERARGYLMDFDMATKLAPPSDPPAIETSQSGSTTAVATSVRGSHSNSGGSGHPEDQAPKAARTGTTPYMATDVLRGHPHTPAHDLESFFYVLYLFLHTYDGPLPAHAHWPRPELFVSGRTRRLPHVRTWPPSLRTWATGALDAAANDKAGRMADADHVFSSLRTELPRYWRARADAHALIRVAYDVFWRAVEGTRTRVLRVGLNHQEFIDALEGWLREYPESAEDMIKAAS